MDTNKYWQERAKNRIVRSEMQGVEIMEQILPIYQQALVNINKDINSIYLNYANEVGLDVAELTKVLSNADKNNFLLNIQAQMRALGFDFADIYNENYINRLTRLEALKQQIYWNIQAIAPKVSEIETRGFRKMIKDSYEVARRDIREQIYGELGGGTFATVNDDYIGDILNSTWEGGNYMTRTAINMDRFAIKTREVIGSGLLIGTSQEKMGRLIRERFDVGRYEAMRLVRTETNYFQNQAEIRSYEDEGVEYYEYMAVMDNRTSKTCERLDGKVFKTSEAEVGSNYPPMHPNCRSTTVYATKKQYLAQEGI
jgi:SPP1 gp7 family putative phage head morphogenesis protein